MSNIHEVHLYLDDLIRTLISKGPTYLRNHAKIIDGLTPVLVLEYSKRRDMLDNHRWTALIRIGRTRIFRLLFQDREVWLNEIGRSGDDVTRIPDWIPSCARDILVDDSKAGYSRLGGTRWCLTEIAYTFDDKREHYITRGKGGTWEREANRSNVRESPSFE